jgi:hypothetical protein
MEVSLADAISDAVFAFRGYNTTNLGRTNELLAVDAYREIVLDELHRFGDVCREFVDGPVDLERRVRQLRGVDRAGRGNGGRPVAAHGGDSRRSVHAGPLQFRL